MAENAVGATTGQYVIFHTRILLQIKIGKIYRIQQMVCIVKLFTRIYTFKNSTYTLNYFFKH